MRWICAVVLLGVAQAAGAAECVVLLHGLGRSAHSMAQLESALAADGYLVRNQSYPSTTKLIEELTPVVGEAIAHCRQHRAIPIHFVTHSMGGILVRAWFQNRESPEAGRVVMLAPPNRGSEVVDAYRKQWWFQQATGPAGQQLGTEATSLPNRLAPIPLEIGVIAGTRSSDPWFGDLFPGAHDGKVSVERAALPEMKEMVVIESGHTFMMNSTAAIDQVRSFLATGAFTKPPTRQ